MGVGAVTTYLIADEVERSRCGIGCVLEDDSDGLIRIGKVMRGGAAENHGVDVGDVIERVDNHPVTEATKVSDVSRFMKGMEGSIITLQLRKRTGESVVVKFMRQRVPGSKAEMLGALWQAKGGFAKYEKKILTLQDKLDKLSELHRRGNLTEKEYEKAKDRLLGEHEQPPPAPTDGTSFLSDWWTALKEDFHKLTADPEVEKRKAQRRSTTPISPTNSDVPTTPTSPSSPPALKQSVSFAGHCGEGLAQDEAAILKEFLRRGEEEENIYTV